MSLAALLVCSAFKLAAAWLLLSQHITHEGCLAPCCMQLAAQRSAASVVQLLL